jgi:alkylation response protein AidB-like acyl-CoA dehydrogenase
VPEANVLDLFDGVPCQAGPLYQALFPVIPLMHHAVHVGIAEGALNDLVAMARAGRQQLRAAVSMQESEIFQYELGRTAADVRAARAALQAQAASH